MKKMLPLAIGAVLMAAASGAFAVTDEEGNASLQFNFSAPGARSLAMGGAFIGLADDATAAANPRSVVATTTELTTSLIDYGNAAFYCLHECFPRLFSELAR